MDYTIRSERLTAVVSDAGAELLHLCGPDGREYLWQGAAPYWEHSAPHLFPYIGRLFGGKYCYRGDVYALDIHGFAMRSLFRGEQLAPGCAAFRLCADAATRRHYPFDFQLDVVFELTGARLAVSYVVANTGARTMYFGLGAHPAFALPLREDLRFEDYALRFAAGAAPVRVLFSPVPSVLVTGTAPYPLADGRLPLRHDLFDDDAVVLRDAGGGVLLASDAGGPGVRLACADFPYLGIWHNNRTEAPFVCLEPWSSLPAREGELTDLETQPDLLSLRPGGVRRLGWSVEIV